MKRSGIHPRLKKKKYIYVYITKEVNTNLITKSDHIELNLKFNTNTSRTFIYT